MWVVKSRCERQLTWYRVFFLFPRTATTAAVQATGWISAPVPLQGGHGTRGKRTAVHSCHHATMGARHVRHDSPSVPQHVRRRFPGESPRHGVGWDALGQGERVGERSTLNHVEQG